MPAGSSPRAEADPFSDHIGIALSLAGKYRGNPGIEDADVRQEAMLALAEALKRYDPHEHGGALAGFIFWAVRGRLGNFYRRWRLRAKMQPLGIDVPADRGQDPAAAAELRDLWRVAGEILTARQLDVLLLAAAGWRQVEIAKRLGVSRGHVSGLRRAAIERLRQALG